MGVPVQFPAMPIINLKWEFQCNSLQCQLSIWNGSSSAILRNANYYWPATILNGSSSAILRNANYHWLATILNGSSGAIPCNANYHWLATILNQSSSAILRNANYHWLATILNGSSSAILRNANYHWLATGSTSNKQYHKRNTYVLLSVVSFCLNVFTLENEISHQILDALPVNTTRLLLRICFSACEIDAWLFLIRWPSSQITRSGPGLTKAECISERQFK
jgi:hypothetical protein